MDELEFMTRKNGEVVSCWLGPRSISKTQSKILFYIYADLGNYVRKPALCLSVFGKHDIFVRRSMDVHLVKIKKFLDGSPYEIDSSQHNLICLRRKSK